MQDLYHWRSKTAPISPSDIRVSEFYLFVCARCAQAFPGTNEIYDDREQLLARVLELRDQMSSRQVPLYDTPNIWFRRQKGGEAACTMTPEA